MRTRQQLSSCCDCLDVFKWHYINKRQRFFSLLCLCGTGLCVSVRQVFSEKMGLEAGWNCHISLSEPTRGAATATAGGATTIDVSSTSPSTHNLSKSMSDAGSKLSALHSGYSTDNSLVAAAIARDVTGKVHDSMLGRRRYASSLCVRACAFTAAVM